MIFKQLFVKRFLKQQILKFKDILIFQRQEVEEAPYPASGFRPEGPQFNLPVRQTQEIPRTIYGPPTTEEVPTTTDLTTEEPTTTLRPFSSQLNEAKVPKPTDEEHETEEPQDDEVTEAPKKNEENKDDDEDDDDDDDDEDVEAVENTHVQLQPPQPNSQEGIYYVLLQNGQLQRVQYATTVNNPRNMAYSTQLRYENVQPISGPIYTFSPENQLYQVVF